MCIYIYIDIIVVLLDSSYFTLSFMGDIMGFSAMVMILSPMNIVAMNKHNTTNE